MSNNSGNRNSQGSSGPGTATPTIMSGEPKIVVHTPMPAPGTVNAPWFDGKDATLFLERFHQLCVDHGLKPKSQAIMDRMSHYCLTWIGQWIKTLDGFKEGDWEKFCLAIVRNFRDDDINHKIHRREYLSALSNRQLKSDTSIRAYIHEYNTVSGAIKKNGRLDDYTRAVWFLRGLPESMRNKVLERSKTNLADDTKAIDFDKIVEVSIALVEQREGNKTIFDDDNEAVKDLQELGEKYQLANKPPTSWVAAFLEDAKHTGAKAAKEKTIESESKRMENMMETLTENMKNLTLALRVQSGQVGIENGDSYRLLQRNGPPRQMPPSFQVNSATQQMPEMPPNPYVDSSQQKFDEQRAYSYQDAPRFHQWSGRGGYGMGGRGAFRGGYRGGMRGGGYGRGIIPFETSRPTCYYCGKFGHQQSYCYDFQQDQQQGYCHIDEHGTLRMGAPGQGLVAVPLRPGIPNMFIVRSMDEESTHPPQGHNAENNQGGQQNNSESSQQPDVKVNAIRIGRVIETDSDDESELESGTELSVNAGFVANKARTGQKRSTAHDRIATMKTNRSGEYVLADEVDGRQEKRRVRFAERDVNDEAMMDVPADARSTSKTRASRYRENPDKLSARLRDSVDPATLMERILDGKIEVTVRELVGVSQKMHKEFFSIPSGSAAEKRPKIGLSEPVKVEVKYSKALRSHPLEDDISTVYAVKTIRVMATICGEEMDALIDTGSEINVMSFVLARKLGVTIRSKPRVVMVVQTGDQSAIPGCTVPIPVQIGDIVAYTPFLLIEKGDNDVILGRPWQFVARYGQKTAADGKVLCEIFNEDRTRRLAFEGFRPSAQNMRFEVDIFPELRDALEVVDGDEDDLKE